MQVHNPHPSPQMQVRSGFRIRTAIDTEAAERVDIPQKYYSCHFCLLYHLKGVCNTHCGGRQLHRPISQSEFGTLGECWDRYCVTSKEPLLWEVATGGQSQASALYAQTGRHRGAQGGRSTGRGAEHNTTPPLPPRGERRNLTAWGPGQEKA